MNRPTLTELAAAMMGRTGLYPPAVCQIDPAWSNTTGEHTWWVYPPDAPTIRSMRPRWRLTL